ncbi:hypothetical protein NKH77_19095 [Streptomyces sp. M19]
MAEEYRHTTVALRLARALWPLQLKAGYWDEVLPALRVATRCADEHQPNSRVAAALHFNLPTAWRAGAVGGGRARGTRRRRGRARGGPPTGRGVVRRAAGPPQPAPMAMGTRL